MVTCKSLDEQRRIQFGGVENKGRWGRLLFAAEAARPRLMSTLRAGESGTTSETDVNERKDRIEYERVSDFEV